MANNKVNVISNESFTNFSPDKIGDNVAIKLVNVTKTFLNGTIKANTNISFEIFKNEVHALIGENGAGKSTLTSIIFGLYEQDYGDIYINGQKVKFKSASDARKHKIGMVHQHFKLVENYTVLENIILGVEPSTFGFVKYGEAKRKLIKIIKDYNFDININDKISNLTVPQQQKVEILKLLFLDLDILIFDEPTAVLSDDEIQSFLQMIKQFKREGKTIIIISHKLNEIKEVADFATVIRHGKVVGHFHVKDTSIKELSEAMVGRTLNTIKNDSDDEFGEVVLKVKNLQLPLLKNKDILYTKRRWVSNILSKLRWSTNTYIIKSFLYKVFYDIPKYVLSYIPYVIGNMFKSYTEPPKYKPTFGKKPTFNFNEPGLDFEIRAGEIFAIAGVSGNGQSELIEYISGLKHAPEGTIYLYDVNSSPVTNRYELALDDISLKPVVKRYKMGMSFVPEDRHKHGLFLDESIAFNTVSNQMFDKKYNKFGFLHFSAINNHALDVIKNFDVRGVASLQDNIRGLSGGNQQKLIIGREVEKKSNFMIFAQPTRGLDLGAIEYIHGRILQAKKEGKAILLLSYELDEILSLADTIAVFNKDRIVGKGSKKEMTRKRIAELMAQVEKHNEMNGEV